MMSAPDLMNKKRKKLNSRRGSAEKLGGIFFRNEKQSLKFRWDYSRFCFKDAVTLILNFVAIEIGIMKSFYIVFVKMFLYNPLGFTEFFMGLNFARNSFVNAEKQEIRIKCHESDVGQMRCKYSECKHPALFSFEFQPAKVEKNIFVLLWKISN